jgi:CubicO group peptidase (beta-lactamase class C family)
MKMLKAAAILLMLPVAVSVAQDIYFPAEENWQMVDPVDTGWSVAGLEAVLAYAAEQRSSGLVMLLDGRILAEGYWEVGPPAGGDAGGYPQLIVDRTAEGQTVEDVASLQKSIASVLAGIARGRGMLDFDAPVSDYIDNGWSRADADQEAAITVRHLLTMTSGLAPQGTFVAPAGEQFTYNTPVYMKLLQVLEAASGQRLNEFMSEALATRIGMSNSSWAARTWMPPGLAPEAAPGGGMAPGGMAMGGAAGMAPGSFNAATAFRSSARDLARLGLLMLAEGMWDGEDIVGDPGYFEEAFNPSQPYNEAYGLLWWLNGGTTINDRRSPVMQEGMLLPTAPDDLVAALGGLGRKIYIVPSLGLVVSRLGDAPPVTEGNEAARDAFDVEIWRRIMTARQ